MWVSLIIFLCCWHGVSTTPIFYLWLNESSQVFIFTTLSTILMNIYVWLTREWVSISRGGEWCRQANGVCYVSGWVWCSVDIDISTCVTRSRSWTSCVSLTNFYLSYKKGVAIPCWILSARRRGNNTWRFLYTQQGVRGFGDTLMGTPIIVPSRKRARCINLILQKNVFCVCLVCLLCVKQKHFASALFH